MILRRLVINGILLGAALIPSAAGAATLREHLVVFFDLGDQDSVTAMEEKTPSKLEITLVNTQTSQSRTLAEEVGSKPMEKFLEAGRKAGMKVTALPPQDEPDRGLSAVAEPPASLSSKSAAVDSPAMAPVVAGGNLGETVTGAVPSGAAAKTGTPANPANPEAALTRGPAASSAGDESKPGETKPHHNQNSESTNRLLYIGTESVASAYIYGFSIPFAFGARSARTLIAAPMIALPFAFGSHVYIAKNNPFEDAHLKGTLYLSAASVYLSYALPFSIMDWKDNPYQVASIASAVAYPLGIWAGYQLGDHYTDQPDRIDDQRRFATGFGLMGFFSPILYFSNVNTHTEAIFRLGLAQSMALATAGHFLSDFHRSGSNVPEGVGLGIMDHTGLGIGVGLEVAALADAGAISFSNIDNIRPWLGAALLGGTLGFMEGLYYFRDSYDSKERGLYNTLGAFAGSVIGGGISVLLYDSKATEYQQKVQITSLLVAGTMLGYWVTDYLTLGMEDRHGAAEKPSWTDRLAFNPIPVPEATTRDREIYLRYRLPGFSYRF